MANLDADETRDDECKETCIEDKIPTRAELLTMFMSKGNIDRQYDSLLLVEYLGGIDVVLEMMLSADDHSMTMENRKYMYHYFCSMESTFRECNSDTVSADTNRTTMADLEDNPTNKSTLKWTLDKRNNILYSLSPFLYSHVFSRYAFGLFVFFFMFPWFLLTVPVVIVPHLQNSKGYETYSWVFSIYWVLSQLFYCIPWLISSLLSVNKRLIARILIMPDNWIIILTSLSMIVYSTLFLIAGKQMMTADVAPSSGASMFFTVVLQLFWTFFLCAVCFVDGMYAIRFQWRLWSFTIIAVLCLVNSIWYEFIAEGIFNCV